MISDTMIEVPSEVNIHSLANNKALYEYVTKRFPKASAATTGIIGGPTFNIKVEYSLARVNL